MQQTILNDAELFSHLFNNKLDIFLFQEINNKKIFISKNGFSVTTKEFEEKDIIQRLKNYIETGIVLNNTHDVHTENWRIFEKIKESEPLIFSELGRIIFSKKFD